MKTSFFSLLTAGAVMLGSTSTILAANDSIYEQRIEKSAKQMAAESMELATNAIKAANKGAKEFSEQVESRLDDTLFLTEIPVNEVNSDKELLEHYNSQNQQENDIITKSFNFTERLGKGFFLFVITIIILIATVEYLKRRQKYKIMEKAIEHNYPLPSGIFGKESRPTTIQHIHYSKDIEKLKKITEYNSNDWGTFRSGIKWCAWSISFLLFFIIVDAPIWVFALVPLIIGMGKLYTAYKIQQAINNSKVYTQEEESTQTTDSQPTPPPFHNNNENKI